MSVRNTYARNIKSGKDSKDAPSTNTKRYPRNAQSRDAMKATYTGKYSWN